MVREDDAEGLLVAPRGGKFRESRGLRGGAGCGGARRELLRVPHAEEDEAADEAGGEEQRDNEGEPQEVDAQL